MVTGENEIHSKVNKIIYSETPNLRTSSILEFKYYPLFFCSFI